MIRKRLLILFKLFCVCFILLSLHFTNVFASEKYGSITIYSHINDDGKTIIISNESYTLIKIADLINGENINKPLYSSFPVYSIDMNASQCMNLALELEKYIIKNNIPFDYESKSNQNGYTKFNHLEQGVYLISQSKMDTTKDKYRTNPVIISIPMMNNGDTIYDVYMEPKFSDIEPPKTDKPKNGKNESPFTGDNINLNQYLFLLIFSSLSVLMIMFRKIHKD